MGSLEMVERPRSRFSSSSARRNVALWTPYFSAMRTKQDDKFVLLLAIHYKSCRKQVSCKISLGCFILKKNKCSLRDPKAHLSTRDSLSSSCSTLPFIHSFPCVPAIFHFLANLCGVTSGPLHMQCFFLPGMLADNSTFCFLTSF